MPKPLAFLSLCLSLCLLAFGWQTNAETASAEPVVQKIAPLQEEANEFHFVVLGDAQFHDPAKFNRVIDQTRQLQPAFVVQVGDLIEGYSSDLDTVANEWQRFFKQIAPLAPIQFLPIPGNHDVYNAQKQVDPQLEALYEDTWGPLYYALPYKNALIIGLNSDSSTGANAIIGDQWSWLVKTLENSQATHKFVFMHRPPALTQNAEELHKLFVRHGVSHVFYGHHHHYHYFEQDGIAYIMTNAAANSAHDHASVGSFHHLLQVSVRGEDVAVAVINADAIHPKNAVHPEDNYDFFDLTRRLAPKQVQLQQLKEGQFQLDIELRNLSRRAVQVMVSCHSSDNRWILTPKVIEPVQLNEGARTTLSLQASYAANRQPESTPACDLKVPFQTAHGEWLTFEHTVLTVR